MISNTMRGEERYVITFLSNQTYDFLETTAQSFDFIKMLFFIYNFICIIVFTFSMLNKSYVLCLKMMCLFFDLKEL